MHILVILATLSHDCDIKHTCLNILGSSEALRTLALSVFIIGMNSIVQNPQQEYKLDMWIGVDIDVKSRGNNLVQSPAIVPTLLYVICTCTMQVGNGVQEC